MREKLEKGTCLRLKNDLVLKKDLAKVYSNYSSFNFFEYEDMFENAFKTLEKWKEWKIENVSEINTIGKIYTIKPVHFPCNDLFVFSLDEEALLHFFTIKHEWTKWIVLRNEKEYTAYYKTNRRITFVKIIDKITSKKYRGKSSCHKEDSYNLNTGKQLAFQRAYTKFIKDYLVPIKEKHKKEVYENVIITQAEKNYLEVPLNYNLLCVYDIDSEKQMSTTQNIIKDFELTEAIKKEKDWLTGVKDWERYLTTTYNSEVQKDNFGLEDICISGNVVTIFSSHIYECFHSKEAIERLVSFLREHEIHRLAVPFIYIKDTNFLALIKEICNFYKDFYIIIMLCR